MDAEDAEESPDNSAFLFFSRRNLLVIRISCHFDLILPQHIKLVKRGDIDNCKGKVTDLHS
jgi:hypothetical protein